MNFEDEIEKPTISFEEYMKLQREEIQRAIFDPEFIKEFRENKGLDENEPLDRTKLGLFWIEKKSSKFREDIEKRYIIVGKA